MQDEACLWLCCSNAARITGCCQAHGAAVWQHKQLQLVAPEISSMALSEMAIRKDNSTTLRAVATCTEELP